MLNEDSSISSGSLQNDGHILIRFILAHTEIGVEDLLMQHNI
jgi:hypothetical protein